MVLGEPVTLAKVTGILLAVAAVLSLANFKGFTATGRSRLRSMLYLLGATLAFGIAGALNKEAINQGSPTVPLVIVQTITFTAASFIHMLATRRVRPNGITLRFAPLVGILQLTWTALLFQSLQTGDASISFPIVQISFVLTAILAVALILCRRDGSAALLTPPAWIALGRRSDRSLSVGQRKRGRTFVPRSIA